MRERKRGKEGGRKEGRDGWMDGGREEERRGGRESREEGGREERKVREEMTMYAVPTSHITLNSHYSRPLRGDTWLHPSPCSGERRQPTQVAGTESRARYDTCQGTQANRPLTLEGYSHLMGFLILVLSCSRYSRGILILLFLFLFSSIERVL